MDKAPARAGRPTRLWRGLPSVAESSRDGQPIWIHLPLEKAERLRPSFELPKYCEALRCRSKRRRATTVHALITGRGEADSIWVACADCTGLMIDGAYAT